MLLYKLTLTSQVSNGIVEQIDQAKARQIYIIYSEQTIAEANTVVNSVKVHSKWPEKM